MYVQVCRTMDQNLHKLIKGLKHFLREANDLIRNNKLYSSMEY